jgi:hypothetical protein
METRSARVTTWIAIALTVAMVIAYFPLTAGNQFDRARISFVAAYVVLIAALLAASLAKGIDGSVRRSLRIGAGGGLLVLGVLALMSIGLPLVIAGVLAFVAAGSTAVEKRLSATLLSAAAAVVAVAVLIAGFEVTQRMITCPAHGYMGGGGTGFVTGPYHYECVNGQLHWASGQCTHSGAAIDANGNVVSTTC